MRIFKIVFWVVLIAFFSLIVYQDQAFFLQRYGMKLKFVSTVYKLNELPVVILFASFFLLGWLIAYLFGLLERYKVGRANKQLRSDAASLQDSLTALKKEVEILRLGASASTTGAPHMSSSSPTTTEETA